MVNWFENVFSSISKPFEDMVDGIFAIYQFFVSVFDGSFFNWLWSDVMWPFIRYVFELFFLACMALPLTLVGLVGDVVDVFAGLSPISAAQYEVMTVSTRTDRFRGLNTSDRRYDEDWYYAFGTPWRSVPIVYEYDEVWKEYFRVYSVSTALLLDIYREAERLGYTNPDMLLNNSSLAASMMTVERSHSYQNNSMSSAYPWNSEIARATGSPYFTQSANPNTYPNRVGEDFFMSFYIDPGDNIIGPQLTLFTYHTHRSIWRAQIQSNPTVVQNQSLPYTNMNRYTPLTQRVMAANGVQPGSEGMYRAIERESHEQLRQDRGFKPKVETYETTILDYFMNHGTVTRVFWGVVLIGIALCLGFSIVAVLRSIGDLQLNRPLGRVIASVGKAMLSFLLVPFLCMTAIALSTMVIRQVGVLFDTTNEYGEAVSVEGALFLSAVAPKNVKVYYDVTHRFPLPSNYKAPWLGGSSDDGFLSVTTRVRVQNPSDAEQEEAYDDLRNDLIFGRRGVGFSDIKQNQKDLDVWDMMFSGPLFFSFIAAWFAVIMLLMIVLVFIRRIFEVIMLYLVSPFFVSTIPLDDGKRFSSWRDMFISRLISGFGSLFSLKIFLLLLPLIWSPYLRFSDSDFTDSFFKILLMVGGIYSTYKSHTLISTIVNPQAAASEQESGGAMTGLVGMGLGAAWATAGGSVNLLRGAIGGSSVGSPTGGDSAPPPSGNANPNL